MGGLVRKLLEARRQGSRWSNAAAWHFNLRRRGGNGGRSTLDWGCLIRCKIVDHISASFVISTCLEDYCFYTENIQVDPCKNQSLQVLAWVSTDREARRLHQLIGLRHRHRPHCASHAKHAGALGWCLPRISQSTQSQAEDPKVETLARMRRREWVAGAMGVPGGPIKAGSHDA